MHRSIAAVLSGAATGDTNMSWRDYWNSDTPIYVNERHKLVHYSRIANDIIALLPSKDAIVLDYGCGEALSADRVARACGHLYLCDGAGLVRQRMVARFGRISNATIMAPEEMARIPDGGVDLIVVNSLVQYLKRMELESLIGLWRAKLKPDGRLLIADVIPNDVGPITDALALIRFGASHGFLSGALIGLVRTALSDYAKKRAELGITQYPEAEMLGILEHGGLRAARHFPNLGHNPARMAFMATPRPE
jgi:SAM-dependent methyltransferase